MIYCIAGQMFLKLIEAQNDLGNLCTLENHAVEYVFMYLEWCCHLSKRHKLNNNIF